MWLAILGVLLSNSRLSAQSTTAYPDIPRIDVHCHVGSEPESIANYLTLRELVKERHGIDLAMWINLGLRDKPITDCDAVTEAAQGRILCCISDFSPHNGLRYAPEELPQWLERGFVGYKIWAGPPYRVLKPGEEGYPYIDHLVHEPTFAKLEEMGMVCASIHIADPNGPWGQRTKWLADPVEYWREINAWTNVLERHPKLVVVNAHAMWAICQDAQIDYLRYMLTTYPNLHLDLAATFQYYHLVNRDNLRSFMVEWADRLLFGTDISHWADPEQTKQFPERYARCFEILETDHHVKGGFWIRPTEVQGLALPRDVLEKIYYKNAMRVYPRVREQMKMLGYAEASAAGDE
jgi:uncharacterized protein